MSELSHNAFHHLTIPDYLIFALMLLVCFGIGFYYGFIEKRKVQRLYPKTSNEQYYLVGGRNMTVFPVAMSLVSTLFSGISYIGTTTEVYFFGTQSIFIFGTFGITGLMFSYLFLPVFHDMKLTSLYEYLEKRYNKKVRLFGSFSYTITSLVLLPVVIFVPALAFNQVTGINIHIITPVLCIICIFYTSVGGLKAVVYTDLVQGLTIYGSMFMIIIFGTIKCGGFQEVWNINMEGKRLEYPTMTGDIRVRHSILAILIGGTLTMLVNGAVNQNMIQRYMSLPTLQDARKALWWFVGMLLFLMICCGYLGMIIYARYHNCDPLTTNMIKVKDQLLPLLVVDLIGHIPGLTGIFFAGLFSAALSSLSTILNSFAAICLEDFWKLSNRKPMSENQTKYFIIGTTVVIGLISIGLVYVVEHLGTVFQMTLGFLGTILGPVSGIFFMGVLMPWVRSEGALIGGVLGMVSIAWICVKAQMDIMTKNLVFKIKPVDISGCDEQLFPNITVAAIEMVAQNKSEIEFKLHHMSYLLYVAFGAILTICIANFVSLLLIGQKKARIDSTLLAPFVRKIYGGNGIEDDVEMDRYYQTHLLKNKDMA